MLGILPCGSGNGLARHLGIPIDIREGLKVILENHPEDIDYATVNNNKFFCTFGVGFDAAVSAAFARKKTRGKLTYIQSTFETYASYEPEYYTISANGKKLTERAFLVAVCNASQYGNNAYIAPSASINDGLLDVTIIHAGNTLSTALVGVDMMTGMIERNMLIHTFRTDNIVIERERRGPSHLDGADGDGRPSRHPLPPQRSEGVHSAHRPAVQTHPHSGDGDVQRFQNSRFKYFPESVTPD